MILAEILLFSGSFAGIWLALWFVGALLLLLVYPVLEDLLKDWHPAIASRTLLLVLAFPFLISLSTTIMLFLPVVENNLVAAHCHEDCQAHVPLLGSIWLGAAGLLVVLLIMYTILRKLTLNIRTANQLMTHLLHLGKDTGRWYQLPDLQPVVFTLGWWRNRIFITEGLLAKCDSKDIDIILQHELAHGRRFDNLRLLLARLFLLVLPASFAQKVYSDLHFYTESSCDFAAAELYGDLNVAETLLRVQKIIPNEFSYFGSELVSAFTGAEVERRIRILVVGGEQFGRLQYSQSISLFVLVLLSFILVDPIHHGIEWIFGLY